MKGGKKMSKKVIAVVFGGVSSEHDISRISAETVIKNLNPEKYTVLPVYITKEGAWKLYEGPVEAVNSGHWDKYAPSCIISPDREHKGLIRIVGDKIRFIPVDLVYLVLHGANGEDGTIQGLLELAGLPYVGCGVLSSAVSMNKAFTKIVVEKLDVAQAPYTVAYKYQIEEDVNAVMDRVEAACKYPVFVKPACAGSSVGITKAHNRDELVDGLWLAAEHDKTIVIEQGIVGRELECAVLGNGNKVEASTVGEILAADEFYSYDAKYNNNDSRTVLPADIPAEKCEEIRSAAVEIFKALDGMGLSRVDFFLEKDTNKVIFNEINTLPGFTPISMYPMLFNHAGYSTEELVDKIVGLGLERYDN